MLQIANGTGSIFVKAATVTFFLTLCIVSRVSAQSPEKSHETPCLSSTVDTFGPEIALKSRAFLSQLKAAVQDNNAEKVSKMIQYPLRVGTNQNRFQIHNRVEFQRLYNQVFTAEVKAKIVDETSSRCLFANYQGFMVGQGEVWFKEVSPGTFKVFSMNVDSDFNPGQPPEKVHFP